MGHGNRDGSLAVIPSQQMYAWCMGLNQELSSLLFHGVLGELLMGYPMSDQRVTLQNPLL